MTRRRRAVRILVSAALKTTDGIAGRHGGLLVSRERDGAPEAWRVEAEDLRAARPRHVLFLCVANSARSQMAEGIARALAPSDVGVSSAGSEPSSVRPEAVDVLREIGIDISGQRSKGVGDVDGPVDAVITLCAEEVCPVWLGAARRLHWGLPDPAAAHGTAEERLEAFRRTRDELARRLAVLFA
jgi:protein-tyrosine-phosphatase